MMNTITYLTRNTSSDRKMVANITETSNKINVDITTTNSKLMVDIPKINHISGKTIQGVSKGDNYFTLSDQNIVGHMKL